MDVRTSLLIVLLALSSNASAGELGTLFTTPAERERLDRLRRGEPATQAALERADPVVTGYVKRSDGKSTVFLDKQPYPAANPRIQKLLEPRIVERYEPIPLPPEPAPPSPPTEGDGSRSAKPAEPAKAPVPPGKSTPKDD